MPTITMKDGATIYYKTGARVSPWSSVTAGAQRGRVEDQMVFWPLMDFARLRMIAADMAVEPALEWQRYGYLCR